MSTKLENGLFIFRRDLRIVDNNGLNFLSTLCNNIYTIFIFTPEQVGSGNKYKSDNAVQFMVESLEDLASEIKKEGDKYIAEQKKQQKLAQQVSIQEEIDRLRTKQQQNYEKFKEADEELKSRYPNVTPIDNWFFETYY